MIDIGVTKLAVIGAIALVVIGPEKLPGLAKTVGTLLGRARRYVADVKAEVNRSMELDELKKMRDTVNTAASDVENSIQTSASDFEKSWAEASGAETFAPLAECVLFRLAFGGRAISDADARPNVAWRDYAAIVAANLASFGIGEWLFAK